ncbi:MAG TPA: hypothetical protein VGN16_23140 [Acidobacteriaceae bacterium]|jgi:hypothetical protein
MTEPLATYVNDHLGGAQIALQLLEAMQEQHDHEEYREFARTLLPEIQADDATLRSISNKIASNPSVIKQAGGWLLEKAARLKLGHTGSVDFSLFESMELLELGIRGKRCLWKALQAASARDARLRDADFDRLIRRAEEQGDLVETKRIELAGAVFAPAD